MIKLFSCLTKLNMKFQPLTKSKWLKGIDFSNRLLPSPTITCFSDLRPFGTTFSARQLSKKGVYGNMGIMNTYLFCSQIKCWLSGLTTKYLSKKQTGKTLIRLLPQKQSDLGLPFLSWLFVRQLF